MMKLVMVLVVAAISATVWARPGTGRKYTTKYDNIDLDEVLNNERLYRRYFNCLMSRGRCTADGKELKDLIPDAIATDCEKCSEKQKEGTEKVIKHILNKRPTDFDELERVYDPDRKARNKYAD